MTVSSTHTRLQANPHGVSLVHALSHTQCQKDLFISPQMAAYPAYTCMDTQRQEVHAVAVPSQRENLPQSSAFNSMTEALRHSSSKVTQLSMSLVFTVV